MPRGGGPTMAVTISVAGKHLGVWDHDGLSLKQSFALKSACGLTPYQIDQGLGEGDPAAWQAVVWHLRRDAEPELALEAVDFVWRDLRVEAIEEKTVPPTNPEVADSRQTSENNETNGSTSSPAG